LLNIKNLDFSIEYIMICGKIESVRYNYLIP
jgi:hypothetical protein